MIEKAKVNEVDFLISLQSVQIGDKGDLIFKKDNFCEDETHQCEVSPILVCGYETFPLINIVDEINGKSGFMSALAKHSRDKNAVIFCAVKSKIDGINTCDTVVVCSQGKLADIVYPTKFTASNICGGDKIKVFASDSALIALFVNADCLVEENWSLVAPLCDIVLCVANSSAKILRTESRMFSSVYGVDYLFVDNIGFEHSI